MISFLLVIYLRIPESYGNFAFSIWVIVNCFTNWLLHYRHPHWLYIRISFSPHLISTHTLLFLFIISSSITILRIMWWCALMALIWISLITVLVSHMSDSLQPHLCSPPGSSVHEILQARMLEWVAIPFSSGSSDLGTELSSSALQADCHLSHQESPWAWGWTQFNTEQIHRHFF